MSDAAFAEEVSVYVSSKLRAKHPHTWLQGRRVPEIPCSVETPGVRLFATTRLLGLKNDVSFALAGWAEGRRRAIRLYEIPHWREVLARQAKGERCVSLLSDAQDPSPHADGFAFAVHDLCHLEKFNDPETHAAQVGFFRSVDRALALPAFEEFSARFDETWLRDLEHVTADMNGSPVFLMAALKMKLKMAIRREVGRTFGRAAKVGGPLDSDEQAAFDLALEELIRLLDARDELADAIREISTKRDSERAGRVVHAAFQAVGTAR